MNKAELIEAIAHKTAHPKTLISEVLDATCSALADGLTVDGEAVLPGIGKLKTAERAARAGRNPKTGEPVQIPARTAVKFSVSKALADTLNF